MAVLWWYASMELCCALNLWHWWIQDWTILTSVELLRLKFIRKNDNLFGPISSGRVYLVSNILTLSCLYISAIERTPTIDGTDNAKGVQLGSGYDGSIQIKNLVFAYPSRPMDIIFSNFNLDVKGKSGIVLVPVFQILDTVTNLSTLNLSIKAGTSVALVGPSGSGKSR